VLLISGLVVAPYIMNLFGFRNHFDVDGKVRVGSIDLDNKLD
jgi:hypothetical protein